MFTQVSFCPRRGEGAGRGGLGLCPGGFLSRESLPGGPTPRVSLSDGGEGLCLRGLCPGGVCPGGSLSPGGLCPGVPV